MKKLSKSAWEKAVNILKHQARPLEYAMYQYYFESGPAEAVLSALAAFQNTDGGFGHGLEPDIRLSDSSVIATTLAFQRFRELHTRADHPLVVDACRYLREMYHAPTTNWPIIPPNVDDAPHATWWYPRDELATSLSNPRAEIAGYLNDYPEHFPAEMRQQVTQAVIDYLLAHPDEMEMHDMLCYIRFSETPSLLTQTRDRVLAKLTQIANHMVERDPTKWREYGLPPLSIITRPDSPLAAGFADSLQHNLDFVIESQGENGAWMPPWSWGDLWPETWPKARQEWSGVLTLNNLRILQAFGRVET
jgi:hypothetical protein